MNERIAARYALLPGGEQVLEHLGQQTLPQRRLHEVVPRRRLDELVRPQSAEEQRSQLMQRNSHTSAFTSEWTVTSGRLWSNECLRQSLETGS